MLTCERHDGIFVYDARNSMCPYCRDIDESVEIAHDLRAKLDVAEEKYENLLLELH